MKKRILVIGIIGALLIALLCGIGGYAIYKSLDDSAKDLGPEFARAEKNHIPLSQSELAPDRAVPPKDNAALVYKKLFDQWVVLRPKIEDQRWESYISGTATVDDVAGVERIVAPLAPIVENALAHPQVQWQIDYSNRAFSSYPVFPAIVDGVVVWLDSYHYKVDRRSTLPPQKLQQALRISNDILASHDPSSLRAAAAIRMHLLESIAGELSSTFNTPFSQYPEFQKILDQTPDIDPLPVWRTTAFLQLDTWENYESLAPEQKELFAAARRDHDLVINAATAEILKFWNTALEKAEGQPVLTQFINLGEQTRLLRERTDPAAFPLQKLWTLDSATQGAGSVDWLIANEQLQITRQALDILVAANGALPEKFDCKRTSVIGQKPYTYERTATGFKLSAKPSDILAPDSMLAQQGLTYEFKTR